MEMGKSVDRWALDYYLKDCPPAWVLSLVLVLIFSSLITFIVKTKSLRVTTVGQLPYLYIEQIWLPLESRGLTCVTRTIQNLSLHFLMALTSDYMSQNRIIRTIQWDQVLYRE